MAIEMMNCSEPQTIQVLDVSAPSGFLVQDLLRERPGAGHHRSRLPPKRLLTAARRVRSALSEFDLRKIVPRRAIIVLEWSNGSQRARTYRRMISKLEEIPYYSQGEADLAHIEVPADPSSFSTCTMKS